MALRRRGVCECGGERRAELPFCIWCWNQILPTHQAILRHPEAREYATVLGEAKSWLKYESEEREVVNK